MSLSPIDRELLERCLNGDDAAWQRFVNRFAGLMVYVVNHTTKNRGRVIDSATREDLVADVFLTLVADDKKVLRRFRFQSSLATYLTVIARRVVCRSLDRSHSPTESTGSVPAVNGHVTEDSPIARMSNKEEVERLLTRLDPREASVVRLYHLEGRSYDEISHETGIAANSIGPMLSRAREKLRP